MAYRPDATEHAREAHHRLTVPCHNRSYLTVGGELIPGMNNRSQLIFLGELRSQILQLDPSFSIFTYYVNYVYINGCVAWEGDRGLFKYIPLYTLSV